jgi:hypothetical protein
MQRSFIALRRLVPPEIPKQCTSCCPPRHLPREDWRESQRPLGSRSDEWGPRARTRTAAQIPAANSPKGMAAPTAGRAISSWRTPSDRQSALRSDIGDESIATAGPDVLGCLRSPIDRAGWPKQAMSGWDFADSTGVAGAGKVNLTARDAPGLGRCQSVWSLC